MSEVEKEQAGGESKLYRAMYRIVMVSGKEDNSQVRT